MEGSDFLYKKSFENRKNTIAQKSEHFFGGFYTIVFEIYLIYNIFENMRKKYE